MFLADQSRGLRRKPYNTKLASRKMNDKPTSLVTGWFRAYEDLWAAARSQMKAAQSIPCRKSSFYMCSMIMSVFTLEAYLNHLGDIVAPEKWKNEREFFGGKSPYRGVKGKLDFLAECCDFPIDKSRRPYQTVSNLLTYREIAVHGRTQWIEDERKIGLDGFWKPVTSNLRRAVSEEKAQRALEDTAALITGLNEHALIKYSRKRGIPARILSGEAGWQIGWGKELPNHRIQPTRSPRRAPRG